MTEKPDLAALMGRAAQVGRPSRPPRPSRPKPERAARPSGSALAAQMSPEARGSEPVFHEDGPRFTRKLPLTLDKARDDALRGLSARFGAPAVVVVRALIDLGAQRPELLDPDRKRMSAEAEALRKRKKNP